MCFCSNYYNVRSTFKYVYHHLYTFYGLIVLLGMVFLSLLFSFFLQDSNNPDHDAAVVEQAYIFEGLSDLGNLAVLNGDGFGFSDANASYVYDTSFLELTDLDAPLNQDPSSRSSPP